MKSAGLQYVCGTCMHMTKAEWYTVPKISRSINTTQHP